VHVTEIALPSSSLDRLGWQLVAHTDMHEEDHKAKGSNYMFLQITN